MKKLVLASLFALSVSTCFAQTTHVITNNGNVYTPDSISVMVGDTVEFMVGPTHPTLEVDQTTWTANGSTALSGGFDVPSGNGKVVITTAKTYYYVCTNHVLLGMKGRIVATSNTVGLEENKTGEIHLYPNPVSNVLHLNLTTPQKVSVYTLNGALIEEFEKVQATLDISHLSAGTYVLVVGEDAQRLKFIKQ